MTLPLEFPLRRGRLVFLACVGLTFFAASLWFTARFGWPSLDFAANDLVDEALRAMGVAATTFFGALTLAVGDLAVRPGPGLVIDDEGIVERTSGMAAGRVRWEEISALRIVRHANQQRVVGLDLHDVEAHMDRLAGWRRWLLRTNMRTGWPAVAIHVDSLGQDAEQLAALLLAERARRTGLSPLGDEPLAT